MNEQHHQELLDKLASVQAGSRKETNSPVIERQAELVTEKAMTDSAAAMISSFGMKL
ncbi:hypothetical protein [Domibacillus robiginosus]|uniref:hypothetical protein n=1 Tax=Domibacillus robiginosus TaxID=1071054 RepID=UPI000A5F46A9|nr:hypothetical protein [Domibacillus robiginosus]